MKRLIQYVSLVAIASSTFVGCGDSSSGSSAQSESVGRVKANFSVPDSLPSNVTSVHFKIVSAGGTCSDPAIAETTSSLEAEALIGSLSPDGSGGHAFADGLMVLPAGDYLVCATPLDADGNPSTECAQTSGSISVVPEKTTEIVLASQCNGEKNGAGDIVTVFNQGPTIVDLEIGASKFITQCEKATITVTAQDPNNDALTYTWEIVSGPAGGLLTGSGSSASFTPSGPGDWELKVTVSDSYGASATMSFPIHVAPDDQCPTTVCPEGSFGVDGACWVVARTGPTGRFEAGNESCARVGLTGSRTIVNGLVWTPELMTKVSTAIGCIANTTPVECCAPNLFIDSTSGQCFTNGFSDVALSDFVNARVAATPTSAPVHACQRP